MPIDQEDLRKAAKRGRFLTEKEVRARGQLHITASNIRRLARIVVVGILYPQTVDYADTTNQTTIGPELDAGGELEKSVINVTKPYRPRILKRDFKHAQARRKMKLKRKNAAWRTRNKVTRTKYMRRWGPALKKRSDRVHQIRKSRGLG